jgi:hypothetical protein
MSITIKKFEGWLSPIPYIAIRAEWTEWWYGRLLLHRRVRYFENGKWHTDYNSHGDTLYGQQTNKCPLGCFPVMREREFKSA